MSLKPIDEKIVRDFKRVMELEIVIRKDHNPNRIFPQKLNISDCADEFYKLAWRIFDVTKTSFVSRSYNASYNLYEGSFIYESVGAHTNLMMAITEAALDYHYGYGFGYNNPHFNKTADGYSYREIADVVRLHDIAENETGDLPDNGSRDEILKQRQEISYLRSHLDTMSIHEAALRSKILTLFREMDAKSSPTGKLLYLADKVSALIVTLCLDLLGHPPMILEDSIYASERDRVEMEMCDNPSGHAYKASEMWAIDFFILRNIVSLDESFFFTALIVMSTLIVNGHWYAWRDVEY